MRSTLISLQVGVPCTVTRDGQKVATGIYKAPIENRVRLRELNLEGDQQADLSAHGGRDKAVCVYPSEHYPFWKQELQETDLLWGAFGENFTTAGLLESAVCLGDRFEIGAAEVAVTQPRSPCFKLNLKFNRDDMANRLVASHRSGFYLRVLREGEVGAGDEIVLVHADENRVSVLDALRLHLHESDSRELLQRALQVKYLSAAWRKEFSGRV